MLNSDLAKNQIIPPIVNEVMSLIAEKYPTQKENTNIEDHEKLILSTFLDVISKVYSMNASDILNCYEIFVDDTLEESRYFFKHGHYRCSTYDEADEYMRSKSEQYMRTYQVGLLVSLFIWPNHKAMRRHFINTFSETRGKAYLEVGVGHGYYFSEAVSNFDFGHYLGIDINENSLHMAKQILKSRPDCQNKPFDLKLSNFFQFTSGEVYDAIVCGEVLEHVENPGHFIRKLTELASDQTLVYITTAINAPEVDHIFLFKNPDELRDLLISNGLCIVDMELFLYKGKSLEACLKRKWPITAAIIARKA